MTNMLVSCASNCGICSSRETCASCQQTTNSLCTGYPQAKQLELDIDPTGVQLSLFRDIRVDESKTKQAEKNTHTLQDDGK